MKPEATHSPARTSMRDATRRKARDPTKWDGMGNERMDKVDCIVVGAGVVGLAIARRLAQAGRDVIIVEAADDIGTGTSSRNSEVIHAGIYYAAGSLMARLCVAGKRALYAYCEDHGVPHRRCGKLIVATSADDNDDVFGMKDMPGTGFLDSKVEFIIAGIEHGIGPGNSEHEAS